MEETKRGRGRPIATDPREMIRFRLPASKLAALDDAAGKAGITRTEAIERAIDAWLDGHAPTEDRVSGR